MREIKVRAWDESRKQFFTSPKWVEFSVNTKGILTAKNYKVGGMEQFLPIYQFTGLQDKNGVDICERCEIDNKFVVDNNGVDYVLIDIYTGDTIRLSDYFMETYREFKITREYCPLS